MKKIIIASIFAVTYQSFAIFGIGAHVGIDNTSVSSESYPAFNITIADVNYNYSLTRKEIKNPLAFGAQLYFDIPVVPIGFELGFEGAWSTYNWTGSNKLTGPNGDIPLKFTGYDYPVEGYDKDFEFAKMGVDITGKWYIFSLPPVVRTFKFYVGGGAGFYFITPIVSREMIETELKKQYPTGIPAYDTEIAFDVDEYIQKVTVMGYHLVSGLQLKIPAIPISFNVDYKYVMTPENDYKDKTNDFSVIKGSLNLYF